MDNDKTFDGVTLSGILISIFALIFSSFIIYRPTRLSPGQGIRLLNLLPWGFFFTVLLLGFLVLLSLFRRKSKYIEFIFGLTGSFLLILTFIIASEGAKSLIDSEITFGRSSVGPGVWLIILGAYFLIFSSLQRLKTHIFLRLILSLLVPIVVAYLIVSGKLNELSIMKEFANRKERFILELLRHLNLSALAVGVGVSLGVPLGIWSFRSKAAERPVFFFVNFVQTIPGLALFGLLIAPLAYISMKYPVLRELGIQGVGTTPALIALTLYTLLPITRNTFTSLKVIQPEIVDAGIGMGMNRRQLLFKVEIPLAVPVVLAGVRVAAVQTVGNATLAALIGAGGMGVFIFQGLGQAVPDLILLGAIPIIFLAVVVDTIMQLIVFLLTPKGIVGKTE